MTHSLTIVFGAEATTRPPTKSGSGSAIALGLLGVLVLGGGAAAFALRGSGEPAPTPSAQAKLPSPSGTTPVAAEPPPAASSAALLPPPTPSIQASPSLVKLEVTSEPPGATVSKNGFQVCDATPCEVTASINETLELQGEKGSLKGKTKVLAQKDQKVTIRLAAPVAVPKGPRMCEVEMDGLKILRPCP